MNKLRLFVYGTMMCGERDHAVLKEAELQGRIKTQPHYTLVDIDVFAVLIDGGVTAVHGELYLIDLMALALVDRACQVPHRFQRRPVTLEDGSLAETHFMTMEQVRGKRRLGHGNWLERFAPRNLPHRARGLALSAGRHSGKR